MQLRAYQQEILDLLSESSDNALVQLDTGAGKTPIIAAMAQRSKRCLLIAHRNILIVQMSEKLAAFGLYHDTISTEFTRRRCMMAHRKHNKNYIQRGHTSHLVASIASLISWHEQADLHLDSELDWVILIDEAHHALTENMWGKLKDIFPKSRIIGFTATPARNDGESLSAKNGGLFDTLIQASGLKENSTKTLIDQGFLSPFECYSPFYVLEKNELAMHPVDAYKKWTAGTQSIVFAPSINNAEEFAEAFIEQGISAACISSAMRPWLISRALDAFKSGDAKVLINVDMVSEGFDVPAIESVILATKTNSFVQHRQRIGRALRPSNGKERAIIVDLCGNLIQHGLPDGPVIWDLEHPPRGIDKKKEAPCFSCGYYYFIKEYFCPKCGEKNALFDRETVGGHYVNLTYLDMSLVRHAIEERKRDSWQLERESKIIWPDDRLVDGLIQRKFQELTKWLAETFEIKGISYSDINDFISHQDHRYHNRMVLLREFSVNDIGKSTTKALRYFKKWQKSR